MCQWPPDFSTSGRPPDVSSAVLVGGGGPCTGSMNKIEQVTSDGHQMSLGGVGWDWGLHSEVQGIMGNGHMGTPSP